MIGHRLGGEIDCRLQWDSQGPNQTPEDRRFKQSIPGLESASSDPMG